jgi:hypothetical protein
MKGLALTLAPVLAVLGGAVAGSALSSTHLAACESPRC